MDVQNGEGSNGPPGCEYKCARSARPLPLAKQICSAVAQTNYRWPLI